VDKRERLRKRDTNLYREMSHRLDCYSIGLELGAEHWEGQRRCQATALASHLLTRYSSQPVAMREYRGGMSTNQLRRTIDFIEANLGGNFGLAELAANVRISPFYFCRLFKQSTGLSPHQFVIRERIEHARQMLKEHRLTTVEIASNLGFSDQSHFARVFRGLVGTTPKHYASRYR
jgi:AraC family transcriptional regulator